MTLPCRPCLSRPDSEPKMPLRQFRARGRRLTFSHYGQCPSASSTDCGSAISPRRSAASSVASTRAGMPGNPSRRATNSRTAISFAALRMVGAAPPAASARRAIASAGKRHRVGLLEGQRRHAGEIEPRRRRRHARRPGQAMGDRDAHVRRAELRDHRPVAEFDQAMDHRLRVDDDVELVGRQREQVMRLDQLKAFVHQRRGIDRDLRPHDPGRMLERLLHRHLAQLLHATTCGTARRRRSG